MKLSYFRQSLQQVLEQRNAFLMISLGFMVVVVILSLAVYHEVGSSRVYLVPTDMRQVGWLDKRSVSPSYLTEMAREMTDLFLNASAENSDYREQQILRVTASENKGDLQQFLHAQKALLKKQDVSTVFFPTRFTPDARRFRVIVQGSLHRYVGNQGLPPLKKTYVMQFRYRHGLLLVSQFNEVDKTKS